MTTLHPGGASAVLLEPNGPYSGVYAYILELHIYCLIKFNVNVHCLIRRKINVLVNLDLC